MTFARVELISRILTRVVALATLVVGGLVLVVFLADYETEPPDDIDSRPVGLIGVTVPLPSPESSAVGEPEPQRLASSRTPTTEVSTTDPETTGTEPETSTTSSTTTTTQPTTSTTEGRPPYRNCTEAWVAGDAPLGRDHPRYAPHLDRDGDGIACEDDPRSGTTSTTKPSSTTGTVATTPISTTTETTRRTSTQPPPTGASTAITLP